MNESMTAQIGDYEIFYNIVKENDNYYINMTEKENLKVTSSDKFFTSIDNDETAMELINMLCENQVGIVHMNDILDEMGYLMK